MFIKTTSIIVPLTKDQRKRGKPGGHGSLGGAKEARTAREQAAHEIQSNEHKLRLVKGLGCGRGQRIWGKTDESRRLISCSTTAPPSRYVHTRFGFGMTSTRRGDRAILHNLLVIAGNASMVLCGLLYYLYSRYTLCRPLVIFTNSIILSLMVSTTMHTLMGKLGRATTLRIAFGCLAISICV